MPAFTAWIDRDDHRKVNVVAATAAHAREYATGRYGKVLKLKPNRNVDLPRITERDVARLIAMQNGACLHRDKMRRLRTLGLIDQVGGITAEGLSLLTPES